MNSRTFNEFFRHNHISFQPRGLSKSTAPPPTEIKYSVFEKFQLRCHLYQARGLIGSDASGLSGTYSQLAFTCSKLTIETQTPMASLWYLYF